MEQAFVGMSLGMFVLVGVDALVSGLRGQGHYTFHRSMQSLGASVGNVALAALLRIGPLLGYAQIEQWMGGPRLPLYGPLGLVVCLFLVDFAFYFVHWALHRYAALWAIHQVHHNDEDYNLLTSMRVSWFQGVIATLNFAPLALLGVPYETFGPSYLVWVMYGFLLHTTRVERLPVLGAIPGVRWLFTSPRAHALHHSALPAHRMCNIGTMFTVWDRMFGTYNDERVEVLGTERPAHSSSAPRMNVEPVWDVWVAAFRARTWRGALAALVDGEGVRVRPIEATRTDAAARWVSGTAVALAVGVTLGMAVPGVRESWLARGAVAALAVALLGVAGRALDAPRTRPAPSPAEMRPSPVAALDGP